MPSADIYSSKAGRQFIEKSDRKTIYGRIGRQRDRFGTGAGHFSQRHTHQRSYYLDGGSQAAAYLISGDRLVEIRIAGQLYEDYIQGTELAGFSRLFGCEAVSAAAISGTAFDRRDSLYSDLAWLTGRADGLDAARDFFSDLSSGSFIDTVDNLSAGFDEKAFLKALRKTEEHYIYDLERVLASVDDVDSFLPIWLASVLA